MRARLGFMVVGDASPVPKDIVIAMLGASAALAGLVLVFLGLVVVAYQAFPGDTPDAVRKRRRSSVPMVLIVFALSLASVGLSLAWLAVPGGHLLYTVNLWLFVAELLGILVIAVAATTRVLQ
jgi:uncharacterized membrane protein